MRQVSDRFLDVHDGGIIWPSLLHDFSSGDYFLWLHVIPFQQLQSVQTLRKFYTKNANISEFKCYMLFQKEVF
jgi:hypothetical protein